MLDMMFSSVEAAAASLFASVLIVVACFLIARVARIRPTIALTLALAPMAIALILDRGVALHNGLV